MYIFSEAVPRTSRSTSKGEKVLHLQSGLSPQSVNGPDPPRSFIDDNSIYKPVIPVQDIGFIIESVFPDRTDSHTSSHIIIIEHSLGVSPGLYGPSFAVAAPLGSAVRRKRLGAIKPLAMIAAIILRAAIAAIRPRARVSAIIPRATVATIISRATVAAIIPLAAPVRGRSGRPAFTVKGRNGSDIEKED